MSQLYLCSTKQGYNPPEHYRTLNSVESVNAFINEGVISQYNVNVSIDNHVGSASVPVSKANAQVSIVVYADDDTGYTYVGTVKSWSRKSKDVMSLVWDVDWYTSQICSYYLNNAILPIFDTVQYRRITSGEFNFSADGIIPKFTEMSKVENSIFSNTFSLLMVYSDGSNLFWVMVDYFQLSAEDIFNALNTHYNLGLQFNPAQIQYFGFTSISFNRLPRSDRWQVNKGGNLYLTYILLNTYVGGKTYIDEQSNSGTMGGSTFTSTESERYQLRDDTGNIIFEFPLGIEYKLNEMYYYCTPVFDVSAPAILFDFNVGTKFDELNTFTIPFKSLPFVINSEQVYSAEEKTYANEMRNFQTLNNLVSGITGATTTGVTVYGFSRAGNTSRGGLSGAQKGLLGFGIGALGAGVTAGYEYLYANKRASEIEEAHAKAKADTVLMGTNTAPVRKLIINGIVKIKYDDETLGYINAYHNRYGYKSNKIDLNKSGNDFTNYVQADVIPVGGLRKDVENYIINMFANGVWFT